MRNLTSFILCLLLFQLVAACTPGLTADQRAELWVLRTLNGMSLREMVSQMFIIGVPEADIAFNRELFEDLRREVMDFGAGGILLSEGDPFRQSALIAELQEQADLPLLVLQDMEQGAGTQVTFATEFPRAMAFGAAGDVEMAYRAGQVTGREARTLGVHMILAPVANISAMPANPALGNRTFGDEPIRVGQFVKRFIEGAQRNGVLATAKYFPRIAFGSEDSSRQEIDTSFIESAFVTPNVPRLLPFREAIDADVGAIMMTHIAVPDTTSGAASSAALSPEFSSNFLRERLAYDGLIVSDELDRSWLNNIEPDSVALLVASAGYDLLLSPSQPDLLRNALVKAVSNGRIPEERIRASVRRVLRAKARLDLHIGLQKGPQNSREKRFSSIPTLLTRPSHRAAAAEVARRSVVALRNNGAVPETGSSEHIMLVSIVDSTTRGRSTIFANAVKVYHEGKLILRSLTRDNWKSNMPEVGREASKQNLVIVADLTSDDKPAGDAITGILGSLSNLSAPVVFTVFGSPYNVTSASDDVDAILLSFGAADVSIRAMSDVLFGRAETSARLPISLSDTYARGSGLFLQQRFPRIGIPEEAGLDAEGISELDRILWGAIADSAFPGAAIAVGRGETIVHLKGYGRYTYEGGKRVSPSAIFDLASLTKVIVTTTAVMQLIEQDKLALNDAVSSYVPEFAENHKEGVTIRDLITHTGGLIPFRPFYETEHATRESVLSAILSDSLVYEPGTMSRYSDFGPIVIALIVEQITGQPFDEYARKAIFEPLGMINTGYRKISRVANPDIVPTERDNYFRNRLIQGDVHDETAYILGGTAGHAGLFSTAEDLAKFAYMIINDGRLGDETFLRPETIRLFTTAVDQDRIHTRALGWDTKSQAGYSAAGHYFGRLSFGHTGFTGTSIWFDRDQSLYVILLTNRVYPTRDNSKHRQIRPAVADIVFRSIRRRAEAVYFESAE